ncbi:hypothetical protein V495_06614 [Pseudogymnoascus sp. VKM F-4514 (FW-929)]|nr:hypothetical protein V495_06614 [Pseudogymnoascus sp. VKM F-4514 (FW-929)]KFY62143.1 hypothetical protein V497_02553 [Pseudogymnoascus sp. VKM F-4516 (FW-969)]
MASMGLFLTPWVGDSLSPFHPNLASLLCLPALNSEADDSSIATWRASFTAMPAGQESSDGDSGVENISDNGVNSFKTDVGELNGHSSVKNDSGINRAFSIPKAKVSVTLPVFNSLDIEALPVDTVSKFFITIAPGALGTVDVPVYAYRSSKPGPVVGITCAIHGNEVNGIPVIQRLFSRIERQTTHQQSNAQGTSEGRQESLTVDCGTIIGIPVVNVPGFVASMRYFDDDSKQDLNRLMPGKIDGAAPQQYAYRIFHNIVSKFDYLLDLHTASLGRRNSLYVRSDMNDPVIARLSTLMKPQVLVHVATKGSLRGCAQAVGVKALTVEACYPLSAFFIGNASSFQKPFIQDTYDGICRVISDIGLFSASQIPDQTLDATSSLCVKETIVCTRSYWIFTQTGGILRVFKDIADLVQPGELIAQVESIFGDVIEEVHAPVDYPTVVVGLEANPIARGGNRVVHLGVIGSNFGEVIFGVPFLSSPGNAATPQVISLLVLEGVGF